MGYILGNLSLKTLTILIIVLLIGLIYSFVTERKRRPGHPTLIVFPMFALSGLSVLAEKIIREYSKSEKAIEVAGVVMVIIIALSFLSLFISVYIAKKKENSSYKNKR